MLDDFETNVRLIEMIRSNPCIYDHTRSDYLQRNKQDKVWGEIAKKLNETVLTSRERWKNIRGRYVKQMKKSSGLADKPKKPYYLSEYLSFLDTFVKSKTPTGNSQPQSAEVPNGESKEEDSLNKKLQPQSVEVLISEIKEESIQSLPDISDGDEHTFRRDEPLGSNLPELTDTSVSSTPEPSASIFLRSKYYRRKNKQTSDVNRFTEERKKRDSFSTVIDPDEAFLRSVLPDMKNMTDAQKRNFKVGVLCLAGEILNQPVETPPSIVPFYSATRQADGIPLHNRNRLRKSNSEDSTR